MRTDTLSDTIERQPRNDQGTHNRRKRYSNRSEVTRAEARHQTKLDRPFIGWDGEGYTLPNGHHCYSLFGNSLGARVEKPNLTWRDCLRLLLESPKDAYHVIYAGTYDVVMMFRDSPVIEKLLSGAPTRLENYRLVFRKAKYLQVTDLNRKGDPEATRILYDVFTFYRSSFVAACREYGVGDEVLLAEVERMKLQRNEFHKITPEVRTYMGQELDLLVQLCDDLRSRLALANIFPHAWHGPGAIAGTVLRREKVGKCRGSYLDDFRQAAESAYYGGRFEQFKRGTHLGPVYQYDIRSAYPAAMTHLPDLSEVTWTHYSTYKAPHSDYALYYVKCHRVPGDEQIGSLPHRNRHGTILFPEWAEGWYWGVECPQVPMRYRTKVWYPTGPGLDARPFGFVAEAYRQRAILKAANQPQEKAIKLMLNSLYGKLAQSKGASQDEDGTWRYPPFHEIVWAGWITAYTRAMLVRAMHSVPAVSVIACETDAVFSTEPIPTLPLTSNLGDWELTTSDGIRYIQSGVSIILKEGQWKFKTRGFTVHKTIKEVSIWVDFLSQPNSTIGIRQTRFGTDPRAKRTFGTWYTMDRQLSLAGSPLEKRLHIQCAQCVAGLSFADAIHPMVIAPCPKQPTIPYKFVWRGPRPTMIADLFEYEDDPLLISEYLP